MSPILAKKCYEMMKNMYKNNRGKTHLKKRLTLFREMRKSLIFISTHTDIHDE